MAKLDALAEKFYKLIHKLAGDTVSDTSPVAAMSINEVCDKLQDEIAAGTLPTIGSGGAGGSFVVTITEDSGVFSADKTLAEINDALEDGLMPVAVYDADGFHNVYQYAYGDATRVALFNQINPSYNESMVVVGFVLKTLSITSSSVDITDTSYTGE